jgi:transcriptional regulator with XRE-family HTH domain
MDRPPMAISRAMLALGDHVSTWRKLQRLTQAQLAERAGVSRDTLRAIETGAGTSSTENLLRVVRALGVLDGFVSSVDPYLSDVGKLRADEVLPQRVRN